MFTYFKRILKSGWLGFLRDAELALATIFILLIAVSVVTSLFLFSEMTRSLTHALQEKVDVSVYFKETTTEEEILNLRDELVKMEEIREINYVSSDLAYQDFLKRHKANQIVMESLQELGENPFLASLSIKAWKTGQYGIISNFLEHPSFENLIEKVDYYQRKPVIERVFSLTGAVNRVGIILSIILIIIAVLITFNTIRLAIYNSREEIKIQRLVGASNWFIRGPFLIQGAVAGVFAALISLAMFALICWLVNSRIAFFFPELNLFNIFLLNLRFIFLIQLLTGAGLGIISSIIAVKKYLKA